MHQTCFFFYFKTIFYSSLKVVHAVQVFCQYAYKDIHFKTTTWKDSATPIAVSLHTYDICLIVMEFFIVEVVQLPNTGGSRLSRIFWEHANLSGLSVYLAYQY